MILGGTLLSRLELNLLMNRFVLFFSFSLLCCVAAAQNLTSDPATGAVPPAGKPGVTETVSPEILQFQKIDDSWSYAVNRRDQYALELVLSPLFVDVSASGDVTTRNQQVAKVLSSDDKTLYLTQKVVTVRMLGDIAVANGTYTLHHKIPPAWWTKEASSRRFSSGCMAAGCALTRSEPCCGRTQARRRGSRRRKRRSTCRTRSRGATRGRNSGWGPGSGRNDGSFIKAGR